MENEAKKMNFFRRIEYSIFKVDKYEVFIVEKPKVAIKYLLKLILIVSIIFTILNVFDFIKITEKIENYVRNDLSNFSMENNKLYFEGMQEAYDKDYDMFFLANTAELSDEDLKNIKEKGSNSQFSLILLNDKLIIGTGRESNEFTYELILNNLGIGNFNRADLIELFNSNSKGIMLFSITLMILLSIFVSQVIYTFSNLLCLFIFAYFSARILRVPLKANPLLNITIYSLTLPIVAYLGYSIIYAYTGFFIPYFDLLYTILSYIYIVAAILIIKSDLIKQTVEIIKVEDVPKEVSKVLEEPKEEEKENNKDDKKDEDNKNDESKDVNNEPDGSEI